MRIMDFQESAQPAILHAQHVQDPFLPNVNLVLLVFTLIPMEPVSTLAQVNFNFYKKAYQFTECLHFVFKVLPIK